ncbi:MAG TPA: S8 family peptidase [Longimicrobium sp.]|jgi:subtilisin family serine protease|uniref:S8 family peptidase n=1 Tax=Longimicrobium sp. TaxID=2029185 RepID=UPI002EDBB82D
MHMWKNAAPAAFLAALAACADQSSQPTLALPDAVPAASASQARVVEGEYIVTFKPAVSDVRGEAAALVRAHGGTLGHTYHHVLRGFSARFSAQAAAALLRNPRVESVGPVTVGEASYTQTSAPWGLDRIDQVSLPLSTTFMTVGGYYGNTTHIYVIDTGIRASHADFASMASAGYDARPSDWRNGLPAGSDCHGHGTHVAATTASTTYGVNKEEVQVIGVKVNIECSPSVNSSDAVAGMDWVAAQKAASPGTPMVANISLGWSGGDSYIDTGVTNLINSGVAVVVAAGNNNYNACNDSPSRVAAAVTVGATTTSDARASFSNWGSCVDLFAPGNNITSASYASDYGSAVMSGTSMAAPHVTGVAALYLRKAGGGASPAAVHKALVDNASVNKLSSIGTGSPNRLLYTRNMMVNVTLSGPTTVTAPGWYTFSASGSGGASPYTYSWGGAGSGTSTVTSAYIPSGGASVVVYITDAGGMTFGTSRYVTVSSGSGGGGGPNDPL